MRAAVAVLNHDALATVAMALSPSSQPTTADEDFPSPVAPHDISKSPRQFMTLPAARTAARPAAQPAAQPTARQPRSEFAVQPAAQPAVPRILAQPSSRLGGRTAEAQSSSFNDIARPVGTNPCVWTTGVNPITGQQQLNPQQQQLQQQQLQQQQLQQQHLQQHLQQQHLQQQGQILPSGSTAQYSMFPNNRPLELIDLLRDMRRKNLFIFHLPPHWTEVELEQAFSAYGVILSARVAKRPDGHSKGYGFVCFEDEESASIATQEMNGFCVGDKRLKVTMKKTPEECKAGQVQKLLAFARSKSTAATYPLFVFHIPPAWSNEDLFREFAPCGRILTAKVSKNADGSSRGFGFVTCADSSTATEAVSTLNGKEFPPNKRLTVQLKQQLQRNDRMKQQHKAQTSQGDSFQLYNQQQQQQSQTRRVVLQSQPPQPPDTGGATIVVSGVPPMWNATDLIACFSVFGPIEAVWIEQNAGFVAFGESESAMNAVVTASAYSPMTVGLLSQPLQPTTGGFPGNRRVVLGGGVPVYPLFTPRPLPNTESQQRSSSFNSNFPWENGSSMAMQFFGE